MKVFSFDAETNGLWGKPFSIGAIVYQDGIEIAKFFGRLPDEFVTNEWVKDNVLPTLPKEVTHTEYSELLKDFSLFYMENKEDSHVICHMGYIVEAFLLREMHDLGFIGDWDAPYPLIDVEGLLRGRNVNSTSVDEYAEKMGLKISDYGTKHNPLYDCEVTAKVYYNICQLLNI